jgi:hypothetical protein
MQLNAGVVDTGIIDASGKFATDINNTSSTCGKICRRCRFIPVPWCTLTCEYLCKFSKKFAITLMLFQGLGER